MQLVHLSEVMLAFFSVHRTNKMNGIFAYRLIEKFSFASVRNQFKIFLRFFEKTLRVMLI